MLGGILQNLMIHSSILGLECDSTTGFCRFGLGGLEFDGSMDKTFNPTRLVAPEGPAD